MVSCVLSALLCVYKGRVYDEFMKKHKGPLAVLNFLPDGSRNPDAKRKRVRDDDGGIVYRALSI